MDGEDPIVVQSALRPGRGISEEDVLHAYANALYVADQQDGMVIYVGPAASGVRLLEIGAGAWHGAVAGVHAMEARAGYLREGRRRR